MLSMRGVIKNKQFYLLAMHRTLLRCLQMQTTAQWSWRAKSDRINALRKQYDMFLEEDKKRKERNDFILGRLDKMRYSTALVPVRHKPSVFETRPAVVDRLGFQPEFSSSPGFQSCTTNQSQPHIPDIQVKNNEDTFLIHEISKKYILIPKLRTSVMNNYISNGITNQNPERLQEMHLDQDTVPVKDLKPSTHDNTDWKSKYEILNILKNEEKGKQTENYQTSFDAEQDVPKKTALLNDQDHVAIDYDNYANTNVLLEKPKEYVNEIPEKPLAADILHDVPKKTALLNDQDHVAIDYDNYANTNVLLEKPKEYVNEIPEKPLAADILHYDLPKENEYSANKVCANGNLDETENDASSENDNIIMGNAHQADAINDQLQNITLEYKESDAPNYSISPEATNYYEPQPEPDVNMSSMNADVGLKQTVHEENVNINDEFSVEGDSFINDQNIPIEQHESAESEQYLNYDSQTPHVNDSTFDTENLAQVSNVQEFAPNTGLQMKTDTIVKPEEQTYLDSNIDTVKQENVVYEQTENPLNITESINDFDTEQREMFYTKETDENYLNQQGDVDPTQFSQNEYPQNEEFAYYENTEPEAYPVELNDEEVTQAYDPHYEQQYAQIDQESEQEQYVEQYQEPEECTNQVDPEFTALQYEQQHESQEKVEETLDADDGFLPQIGTT